MLVASWAHVLQAAAGEACQCGRTGVQAGPRVCAQGARHSGAGLWSCMICALCKLGTRSSWD